MHRGTPEAVPDPVLRVEREGARARIVLARPEVRNAFNAELIARLRDTFLGLADEPDVRVVILEGEGKTFCGGADVNWMRGSLELSEDDNVRDAEAMSDMYRAIDRCPKPVIAKVHGAARRRRRGLVRGRRRGRRGERDRVRVHRDEARHHPGGDLAVRDREDRRLARAAATS